MKTFNVLLVSLFVSTPFLHGQFVEHTQVYGQVQTDINKGYRIRLMPDNNFMIAGQWNDQAYLAKVDCSGNTLATRLFGNEIAGISSFVDVQQLPDSSWVAMGTCDHCMPGDTTAKVVLLKVDSDLHYDTATGVTILGKSARYQQIPASTHNDPHLLIDGQNLVLVSGYGLLGSLNASDFMLTKLNFGLDTLSTRLFHHQYFDQPVAIFKNPEGYKVVANHAFVSGAATIQIDNTGNVLWTNIGLSDVTAYSAVVLPNGNVLVCGTKTDAGVWVGEFSGNDGSFTGNEIGFNGERATDIQLLPNGDVLLAAWFPLLTGARSTRIYRLQTNPLQVAGSYDLVPNPDIFTNMGSHSIVPLAHDGTSFSSTGVRGFYNRTFFHTKRDCKALTAPGDFSAALCPGEFVQVGNTVFDEDHPSGTGVLPGVAACGCDSTVHVALSFYPAAASDYQPTVCAGESVMFGGQLFNAAHPAGDVVLEGQSAQGCDSTVHVALSFYPAAASDYKLTVCAGESLTFGGQLFNAAHPAGDVVLAGQSAQGCDSTVHVALSFYPAAASDYKPTICAGEMVTLGGQLFNAAHPAGDVVLAGQSAQGCDSTVHVALSFYPAATGFITDTLSIGDSLRIGNSVFSMANPSGTVILENASYTGCDSTVVVDLKFVTAVKTNLFAAGDITVIPNPVLSGQTLMLQYAVPSATKLQIACFDATGNTVWSILNDLTDTSGVLIVPAPQQAGLYWLTVMDAKGHYAGLHLIVL